MSVKRGLGLIAGWTPRARPRARSPLAPSSLTALTRTRPTTPSSAGTPTPPPLSGQQHPTVAAWIRPNSLLLLRNSSPRSPRRALPHPHPSHQVAHLARAFHSTRPTQDIFFVTVPAFKQALLTLVRVTLIALPFAWRWGLFKRFPTASKRFASLPLLAFALVVAFGLNQSPRTARWRLLLMSEREELEWSNQRFDELIATESVLILKPDDERVETVQRVCSRLVQALQEDGPVSCALLGPREEMLERIRERDKRSKVIPSAVTEGLAMPFMPESSNPEKLMPASAWNIFVIDRPEINAFVLPSTDIFVYTGLLSVCEGDENLLAAVLAHEISHVVERHATEALGFLALSGVIFDVLRGASWALTISFPIVGDALAAAFTFLDRRVAQKAYSRKLETEADALGLEIMARAGFDPRGALSLWEILNEVEDDVKETGEHGTITENIELLRTHPTGQQRLETLQALLPAATKIYDDTRAANAAKHRRVVIMPRKPDATIKPVPLPIVPSAAA